MAKRKLEPVNTKKTRKGNKPGRRAAAGHGVSKEVTKCQNKKGRPLKIRVSATSNLQYAANPDCESAEDLLQPLQKDGDTVLEVECGTNKAHLYLSKLCQGSKGSCIEYDGSWLTPNEFQFVSGRESAKDWKRSIRHYEKSLKLLLAKGVIALHSNSCDCDGNCSRKIAGKCPLGITCCATTTRGGKRRKGREQDGNSSADDNSEGNDTDKDLSNSNDNDKSDDDNNDSDDNDDDDDDDEDDDDDDDEDESDFNETDGTDASSENVANKEEHTDTVVKGEQSECDETLFKTKINSAENSDDIKREPADIYGDAIEDDHVCTDDDDKTDVKCMNNNNNNNCVDIAELLNDNTSNANGSDNGTLDEEIKGLVSELDIEIDDGEETEDYMDADEEDIMSLVEQVGIKPLEKCDPEIDNDSANEPLDEDNSDDIDGVVRLDISGRFIHTGDGGTSNMPSMKHGDKIAGGICEILIAEASETPVRSDVIDGTKDGLSKEEPTRLGQMDSMEPLNINVKTISLKCVDSKKDISNTRDDHHLDCKNGKHVDGKVIGIEQSVNTEHMAGSAEGTGQCPAQPSNMCDDSEVLLTKTPRDHPAKPLMPVREYRLTSIIAQLRTRTVEADPNDPFAFTECDDEISCDTSEPSNSKKRSPGQRKSPAKKGASRKKAAKPAAGKNKAIPGGTKRQTKSRTNNSTAPTPAKTVENLTEFQPSEPIQSSVTETPAHVVESKVDDPEKGDLPERHAYLVDRKPQECVSDRLTDKTEYLVKCETGNSVKDIVYPPDSKPDDAHQLIVGERREHVTDNKPLEHLKEDTPRGHLLEPSPDSVITVCPINLPESVSENSSKDIVPEKHTFTIESLSTDSFLSMMAGMPEHVGPAENEVSHMNRTTSPRREAEDDHEDSLQSRVIEAPEPENILGCQEFDMRDMPEVPEPEVHSENGDLSNSSASDTPEDQCETAVPTQNTDHDIDALNNDPHATSEGVTTACDQDVVHNTSDIANTLQYQFSSTELALPLNDPPAITIQALSVEKSISETTDSNNVLVVIAQSELTSPSATHDSGYNLQAVPCPDAGLYPDPAHSPDADTVLDPNILSNSGTECKSVENERSQYSVISLSAMCQSQLMCNAALETSVPHSKAQYVVLETNETACRADTEHYIASEKLGDSVYNVTESNDTLPTTIPEDNVTDALGTKMESRDIEHVSQPGSPEEASQMNTISSCKEIQQEMTILANIDNDRSSPLCESETIHHANTGTENNHIEQMECESEGPSTGSDSLDNTMQIQGTTQLLCSLMDIKVQATVHDSQLSPSTGFLNTEISHVDIASKRLNEASPRDDLIGSVEKDNKQILANKNHTPVVSAVHSIIEEGNAILKDGGHGFDGRSAGSLIDSSSATHGTERVVESLTSVITDNRSSSVLACRPHDYYMPIASAAMEYKLTDSALSSREPGEIIRNRQSEDSFESRDHVTQTDLSAEIRKRVAAMLTGITDEATYPSLDKSYRFVDRVPGDSKRDREACDVRKQCDIGKSMASKSEVSSSFESDNSVASSNVSSSEKGKCINSEINHDFLSRSRRQMEQEAARFRQPRRTDDLAKSTESEKRRTSTALGTYMDSILSSPDKFHSTSASARSHDTSGRAHSTSDLSSSSWLRHTGQTHSDKQKTSLTENKTNQSSSVLSSEKLKTSPTPNPLYDASYLSKYTAAEKRLREQSLLLLLHQQEKHYHQQMKMQQSLKDDSLHKITSHRMHDKDRNQPYYHSTKQTVAAVKPRTKETASEKKPTATESRTPSSTASGGTTAAQLQLPLGIPYAMSLPASVSEQLKLTGDAAKTNNYMNMLAAANLQYPMLMPSLTQQHDSSHASQQAVANMFPGLPYPYSMTPFYMPQMFTKEAAAAAAFLPAAMFPVFPTMPFLQSRMGTAGTTLPSTTSVLSPSSAPSFSSSLRNNSSPNVAKYRTSVTSACSPKLSSQTNSSDKFLSTDCRSMTAKRKISESELALDLSIKKHKHSQSAKPHILDPSSSATRPKFHTTSATGPVNMHRQSKHADLASVREKSRSSSNSKSLPSSSCYCSGLYPVQNWTVDEVCTFLCALDGCAVYVERFREHGVDGRILPLLTVDQLTHSLGMKLGPAVLLTQTVAKLLHLTSTMSCERCKAKETSHTPSSTSDSSTSTSYRGTGWSKLPGSVT